MSELWKPFSREIYQHWVNTIRNEAEGRLSKWERDFLTSIDYYLARHDRELTQLQADKLEAIYVRYTNL